MRSTTYKSSTAKASKIIGSALMGAESDLHEQLIEHEPAMTDRMLGRIAQALEGAEICGIIWKAKTLTDRGRGSQESRVGADFVGVLEVKAPDYFTKKGFLAQAKMLRRNRGLDTRDLVSQCENMLKLSPAAYVFLYTENTVEVVSAISVVASSGNLNAIKTVKAKKFFQQHLECMIGDRNVSTPSPAGLEKLLQTADARSGIHITAASPVYA